MTFDPTKETDIEGMTDADFGVWKAARQSEVRTSVKVLLPFL